MSDKLNILIRHISHVRDNCLLLGTKLFTANSESDFARQLIANGMIHDQSKFNGIEWDYLHGDIKESNPEQFLLAANQHIRTNPHHPEYWGSIQDMPRIYVAEMCADWLARSQEFGGSVWDWISGPAMEKFHFTKGSKVYKQIKEFTSLMVEEKFE